MQFFLSNRFSRYRGLYLAAFFSLVVVAATYLAGSYYKNKINQDWESISESRNENVRNKSIAIFNNYQNSTLDFSSRILSNKKLSTAFVNQNTKKSYDYLGDLEQLRDYNIEVYNSRLELFLFYGKQLNPDITELTRAYSGEIFSMVKEIGFYTYLMIYRPIPDSGKPSVLVTAKLIDTDYPLKNKFFKNSGLTDDISSETGTSVNFNFKQYHYSGVAGTSAADSNLLRENNIYELHGINGETIGQFYIPKPEKTSYIEDVNNKFLILLSTELFLLSIITLSILIYFAKKAKGVINKFAFLKTLIIGVALAAIRYFWLFIDFPQKLFNYLGIEIFSPSFYASSFGYGIARSIGELLVTSIMVLIFCIYIVSHVTRYASSGTNRNKFSVYTIPLLSILIIFLSLQFYGYIMQSLIFDSNLKYFDRSQIISTGQYELLFMELAALLISISLIIILLSAGLSVSKFTAEKTDGFLTSLKLAKAVSKAVEKNSVLITFALIILINVLLEYLSGDLISFSLKLSIRNLILILTALFVYYFNRQLSVKKDYAFATVLNISLTVLICLIIIPVVLLNKIISQENKYIELLARKSSEQVNDKVTFMLSSSLEDLEENPDIETDILNKNKYPKIAFSIWSGSKLSSENLSSAVFVLDTSKHLISDFNINPLELNSDSVVNFTLKGKDFSSKKSSVAGTDEEIIEPDKEDSSPQDFEADILENKEMKYYSGVIPVEKAELKNSKFRSIIGYIIMAVQYDSKPAISGQPGTELFRNFTKDNLENKLISVPVISEFTNGELISSSDREISKSFIKSIDVFRESVKDKIDKSAWRYDEFENNIYKSFYVLTSINREGISEEKIFIASSKINDFGTMTFFAFKYLLFVVLVYSIFLLIYISYKALKYLRLPRRKRPNVFGYREKLFAAFFIVSVIPIIILAVYTREFVENKNMDFYKEQLLSDLKLVNQYIKNKIPPRTPKPGEPVPLSSQIFGGGFPESHKNFNLFVRNKLVSTTNGELYKSDLLDTRISAMAYYNIVVLKKDYFVENQEIGNFKFIVGYKPVYDEFNNLLGIISSQTFFKQYEINEELTKSMVYILGTYFIAVIFLVFIVNILSYRISNPVIKLLRATEQLSMGNTEVQVKSRSKDEIGELVKSFNKMIKELKRSREELKKAERESAWRDIARQVAHEIKNPLTPIKLAVQHLNNSYRKNSKDFKEILHTTHKMIIDQIESLNRIATEFSDFAKLPSRNYEPLKINELIKDVVKLFNPEDSGFIKFNKFHDGKIEVLGDKDQVKRALINILRNSIQAIEQKKGEQGIIIIDCNVYNSYYCISIKDNGIGMDWEVMNNLFEPYFSTKSKGMGLGLMITKKIMDDMKGKIYIKSEPSKGTEVELRFKII